jgi:beta-glucanase (GH16 family)
MIRFSFIAVVIAFLGCWPAHRCAADDSQWKLAWSDDFTEPSIDPGKWTFDIGNGQDGWGNHELEYYTSRPDNAFIADGMLHLRAVKEDYHGHHYTSAKMLTRGRFAKLYGRFEFMAKLPVGKGMWPAIWMMPEDEVYGGWPSSGEIDILESRGDKPGEALGTLHFGSVGGHDWIEDDFFFPAGQSVNEFHVYDIEWEPGIIRYFIDNHPYAVKRTWWSSGVHGTGGKGNRPAESMLNPWPAPFDKPFYIIFNVAVGGDFVGKPDEATVFPQEMQIKYVRVYDRVGGYDAPLPPEKETAKAADK